MNKKQYIITVGFILLLLSGFCTFIAILNFMHPFISNSQNSFNIKLSVSCYGEQYREGILINTFGDTEVLTNIGINFTAFKISGDTDWLDAGSMLKNITFHGWGDQGSLSAASVILPSEIIRTDVKANFTYISLGKWNYTAYWKPTGAGNVDCVGMYWHSTGNNLFCYDVFGQIAYTATDEFYHYWQFTVTYS